MVEAVEVLWGQRYVNECERREIYEDESLGPIEKSRDLVDEIEDVGRQPIETPDSLSSIKADEVKRVCWMVVAFGQDETGRAEVYVRWDGSDDARIGTAECHSI